MTEFGSVITAMITPFTEAGEIDFKAAINLGKHLIKTKSSGLLLVGTTGESPTLTHEEEYAYFTTFQKELGNEVHLMAGTGSNSTRTAIEVTQKAEAMGMHSSLQVVPYYNKPCQEGMYRHFKEVAKNTGLPIMLYNIPGRTGANMLPETIARLAEIPNIVAIKEAAGSVEQVKQIRALTPPEFKIYSGDDGLTLDFMKEGACGVVSVGSHIVGTEIADMISKAAAGEHEKAQFILNQLNPLFDALFMSPNPAPVKAALNMMGFNVGVPRLPLIEAPKELQLKLKTLLADLNKL